MTASQPNLLLELVGGVVALVFTTGVIAVPLSFATLWIYRRRIARSLESSTIASGQTGAATGDTETEQGAIGVRCELTPALATEARRHRRNLARLYSCAGLALALAFAVSHGLTSDRFWQAAIPCSLFVGLNLLVLFGRWRPGPWLVALLMLALYTFLKQDTVLTGLTGMVILLGLLLHPRIRAVAPMAWAFLLVVGTATSAAIATAVYLWVLARSLSNKPSTRLGRWTARRSMRSSGSASCQCSG